MDVVDAATPVTKSAHMYFVILVSRAEVRIRSIGCDMFVLIGTAPGDMLSAGFKPVSQEFGVRLIVTLLAAANFGGFLCAFGFGNLEPRIRRTAEASVSAVVWSRMRAFHKAYRAELERLEFNEIVSLQGEFSTSWSPYVLCGTVKPALTDEPDRGRVL